MEAGVQPLTRRHKLAHELKQYLGISLYLYVCFGAIILYKMSVLEAHGVNSVHYGLAAIKALILAKFMLVGHELHVGERHKDKPLVYNVLYASTIFLAMLAVLEVAEELAVGAIHHRPVAQTFSEIADGKWMEIAATCFLLWLILLPYFGFRGIGEALGQAKFHQMLFGER